jgi:hypothetical protein
MERRGRMLSFCMSWGGKAKRRARRTENRESQAGQGLRWFLFIYFNNRRPDPDSCSSELE